VKTWRMPAAMALLAVVLAGCTPSMVLAGASCRTSLARLTQVTGDCERRIKTLAERQKQSLAVQTSDIAPYATVDVEVTVDEGTVEATFTDDEQNAHTFTATPESPARGRVRVKLTALNQIVFDLAPVGGEARGVNYHLAFDCECMP
jgi:hypothetical protein